MLGVDVGDDGDGRGQTVEGAVALIGLDHHPFALPHPRVGPVGVDDPAVDHSRVDPASDQQFRHKRCGRCFAVCTRHRDVGFEPHQLGQHFRTAHDGQTAVARGIKFGVALFDGRRDHNHVRAFDVFRLLAYVDGRAQ